MTDADHQTSSPRGPHRLGRFVVAGEVLACPRHAEAVGEYARAFETSEACDDATLTQLDESLRCFECQLIVAAVLGDSPSADDEAQRALDSYLQSRRTAPAAPTPLPFTAASSMRAGLRGRGVSTQAASRAFAFVSIAASVLMVVSAGLVWQNYRLRHGERLLEERLADLQAVPPLEHLNIVSRSEPTPGNQPALPAVAAVMLMPGLSRGLLPSRDATALLTPSTRTVDVSLRLDGADYSGDYRVTIEGPDGAIVHSIGDLKSAASADAERTVMFAVPASLLRPGGYIVRLSGVTPSGGVEVVNDYRLSVSASPGRPIDPGGTLQLENHTGAAMAVTVNGRSAVLEKGTSTMALPPGEFPAAILSKCGMETQPVTIRSGVRNVVTFECER